MRGEPFTPCKLRRVFGVEIPEGVFLVTSCSAYRVDRVRGRTLYCTRWPIDEIPSDAGVWVWHWSRRGQP